jgi:hypothetical protein
MSQWPYVLGSYAITLGGIAIYVWRMLRSARVMASKVSEEDRPWT